MSGDFFIWTGRSGKHYAHTVYRTLPPYGFSGNYVMARRNRDGGCTALYIGETDDILRRWKEHTRSGLRHNYPTPLNQQRIPQEAWPFGLRMTTPPKQQNAFATGSALEAVAKALAARNAFDTPPKVSMTNKMIANALGTDRLNPLMTISALRGVLGDPQRTY